MDLEDLRAAQTRERATDGLQDLRDSFYEDVAAYIEELREQREQAAAETDDPFGSSEVQNLTDEIETAEQVAEAIYERRIGKIVKQASLAAAGVPDEKEGLTAEETELYADIVERIKENKSHVLDVIAGEIDLSGDEVESSPLDTGADSDGVDAAGSASNSTTEQEAPPDIPPNTPDAPPNELGDGAVSEPEDGSGSSAAAAMGGDDLTTSEATDSEPEPEAPPDAPPQKTAGAAADGDEAGAAGGESVDRTTVRIMQDVGEIFGVDERQYTLETDDIVTLPLENADPLVEREAAEKLSK